MTGIVVVCVTVSVLLLLIEIGKPEKGAVLFVRRTGVAGRLKSDLDTILSLVTLIVMNHRI